MKKVTMATMKSFVRKNSGKLILNVTSAFDGMIDGCTNQNGGFQPAIMKDFCNENTLGLRDLWLVGGGRDRFSAWENETMTGIAYSNCCGCGIVAIKK